MKYPTTRHYIWTSMLEGRITLTKGAIIVKNDALMKWWSLLTGLEGKAFAGAFYPFIFTTSRIPSDNHEAIINHELIHFAQQREMLIIGSWLLWIIEFIYWRLIRSKSAKQTYLLRCVEQEAYDKMWDLGYLDYRPRYSHLRNYLRNKPVKRTLTATVL